MGDPRVCGGDFRQSHLPPAILQSMLNHGWLWFWDAELRCAERCGGKALSVTDLELGRGLACGRRDGGLAGGCRLDLAGGVCGCQDCVWIGISFLRFNEVLTRARARLELRSGGIHVNFV